MSTHVKYLTSSVTKDIYGDSLSPATQGSAGVDLRSTKDIILEYNQTELIPTGLSVQIPENHVGLVFLRSSIGYKGLRLTNGVGVIDSDYRGEILLSVQNHIPAKFYVIKSGERIGQLVVVPILAGALVGVESLDDTDRGSGGFGSTGEH